MRESWIATLRVFGGEARETPRTAARYVHAGPAPGGGRRKWMAGRRDRRARRACAPRALSRGNPALSCIPPTPPPPTRAQRRRDVKLHPNTKPDPRTAAIHHHHHHHPTTTTTTTNTRTPAMSTNMDEDIDSKPRSPGHGETLTDWLAQTVDPTLRDTEEQIVVDKIINEGTFASASAPTPALRTLTGTACRVQDLEEERPVPLRPDSEVCSALCGVPAA